MPAALEPQTPAKPPRFALPRLKQKPPRPRPEQCLNCGRMADGNFCAFCGQENKDHTVALRPLLSDLLAEVASWDSKLMQTLIPLVIRPGFLTNEYNAGRRIGYLSPLKLYLTVSVLFFLVLSWKAPLNKNNVAINTSGVTYSYSGSGPRALNARTVEEYDASQKRKPPARRDPPLLRTMIHHLFKAKEDSRTFVSAILGGFPKMMFFLLPLFAVTLKLLYLRTKRLYVEHLIFLLHVHAFAFLVLTPLLLLPPVWRGLFVGLALPVYFIAALRAVYKQGWPKTLTKFALLGLGYVLLLALCFVGTTLVALLLL